MSVRSVVAVLTTFGLLSSAFAVSLLSRLPSVSAQYPWNVETLAPGQSYSIAVDALGRVHALFDNPSGVLTYGLKVGASWRFQNIDVNSAFGSIALAPNGSPGISYFRITDLTVRYAYENGPNFTNETVDWINGTAAREISLAVDNAGRPHIAYWNRQFPGSAYLMYAFRNDSGWTVETVLYADEIDGFNEGPSIALDSKGNAGIASTPDSPMMGFVYSRWNGSGWSNSWVDKWFGNTCCRAPSLRFDSRDNPHAAYYNLTGHALRYARYSDMFRVWTFENVYTQTGNGAEGGASASLAIDGNDQPRIGYFDTILGQLVYFYHDPSGWHQEVPDSATTYGIWNPIALDPLGAPHILYTGLVANNTMIVKHAWQVWPDTVPPSSSVNPVKPYWHNSLPLQVNATATDPGSGVTNVTLWYRHSLDNRTWDPWTWFSPLSSPPWSWSFTYPEGEGYYEFYTTSADNNGNVEPPPASADAIAGYDITPPVSTAIPISPYWHTTPYLTVSATATDNLSGVADVTFFYSHAPLSNASWSPWTLFGIKTSPPLSWSFPFPDGEGNYMFHTTATDNATNVEGSKDFAEAIAGYRIPPDYTPVNALPPSPLTVGLSLHPQLSIEVFNLGGFENVTSTLAFYNGSAPSSPFFTVQVPPIPTGSMSGPFTANWISPAAPCTCRITAHVDYFDDLIESNETNNAFAWTVNVVPGPITSLVIGTPNYTSTITYVRSSTPLDFSVLDQSGKGINHTRYRTDGGAWTDYTSSFFPVSEGEHLLEWYSEDKAGNVEDVNSRTLRVDDASPDTTLSIGNPKYMVGGNFVTSSTPLSLQAVDGGTTPVGVQVTRYRVDGGSWSDYSSSFTLAGEGTHAVEYYSRDFLTNDETASSIQMIVDDTPPATTLSIGNPNYTIGDSFVKSSTPLTLMVTDDGVGANSTFNRLWDGAWSQWREYTSFFTMIGRDGTWFVGFLSFDFLGNREVVRNVTLVVDNTPPSISISPEESAVPIDTHFTISADDGQGSGVASLEYRTDGGDWTPYSSSFVLSTGHHLIDYRSWDNLNNSAEKRLPVDMVGPATPPEGRVEVNYKPLLALVFAIILAVIGLCSSKKRPWKNGVGRKAIAKAFTLDSVPFVFAEILTGMFSLSFEPLRVPPVIGWGTGVDILILVAGALFSLLRIARKRGGGVESQDTNVQKQLR